LVRVTGVRFKLLRLEAFWAAGHMTRTLATVTPRLMRLSVEAAKLVYEYLVEGAASRRLPLTSRVMTMVSMPKTKSV